MSKAISEPILLHVTRADIRKGIPGSQWLCAVALSLQRATGTDSARVVVDGGTHWLVVGNRRLQAPYDLESLIIEFDSIDDAPDVAVPRSQIEPLTVELPPLRSKRWKKIERRQP